MIWYVLLYCPTDRIALKWYDTSCTVCALFLRCIYNIAFVYTFLLAKSVYLRNSSCLFVCVVYMPRPRPKLTIYWTFFRCSSISFVHRFDTLHRKSLTFFPLLFCGEVPNCVNAKHTNKFNKTTARKKKYMQKPKRTDGLQRTTWNGATAGSAI